MRNVNPEWFYGWDLEPTEEIGDPDTVEPCEQCGNDEHSIEDCEVARALDDDAAAWEDHWTD